MDLWIRSQDKEKLLKVNDIAIEMNMIYGYFDKNTEYELLGTYKSKERALEVLDEIQNILKNNQYGYKVDGLGKKVDIIPNQIFVYEMPMERTAENIDLENQLEEKDKVIDELYKYFNNFDIKSLEEQGLGVEVKEFIINPLEILQRGKNEK